MSAYLDMLTGGYDGDSSEESTGFGYSGDGNDATAVGLPAPSDAILPGDIIDTAHMGGFNPPAAQQAGVPWWQGIAAYGITKAIDNVFPSSPMGQYGNIYGGSGAGWNGRTFSQRPVGMGGGVQMGQGGASFNIGAIRC